MALVYRDLRRRAAAKLQGERAGHTLQPTALVHEAYIRLAGQDRVVWRSRAHFLAVATEMMRRILVDRARARRAGKRSGRWAQITLNESAVAGLSPDVDVLDLHAALEELGKLDPRKARIAELKFFGGLSLEEMAELMELSPRTVDRHWQAARAWLFRALSRRRTKP
jgi:RNA polymerase sigma factor (TIGR02999 family)